MKLVDVETNEDALAAYIEAGRFFKVLVPPGTFHLKFASGTRWYGDQKLFGSGQRTAFFKLDKPLTFEVRGIGTKVGHLVDLSVGSVGDTVKVDVQEERICQTLRLQIERRDEDQEEFLNHTRSRHGRTYHDPRFPENAEVRLGPKRKRGYELSYNVRQRRAC
ncbi:hypothetical protein [uncultured Roseobacter sp.]|uniref:hypothetical protein n=1 Tax=uncultured Roseobacter sp. TaxID=114847 RepID=UPI00261BA398|nr:hypothetical protein [uncultured Roseobacter sp.]